MELCGPADTGALQAGDALAAATSGADAAGNSNGDNSCCEAALTAHPCNIRRFKLEPVAAAAAAALPAKFGCHASAPWLLAAQLLAAQLADWKLTRQGCMCVLMLASILSSAAWSALISSLRLCFSSIILCICLSSCCNKIVGYKQQDSTCLCDVRGASCTLMARDTHVPAHPDACHYCGQQTASTQHASTVGLSTKLHLVDN